MTLIRLIGLSLVLWRAFGVKRCGEVRVAQVKRPTDSRGSQIKDIGNASAREDKIPLNLKISRKKRGKAGSSKLEVEE